jgi:hypothetical protein
MKKLTEYLKTNRNLLIIVLLIFVLVFAVILINKSSEQTSTSVSTVSSQQTDTEKKLCEILSNISGVGETQVLITEGNEGIEGVVVVCAGANNIMTRNNILNAVSTALNIEKNKIAIYAMN